MYQYPLTPNEIYHYGIPRRSGRYPWGSGDRPYQSVNSSIQQRIAESKKKLRENNEHKLTNDILNQYKSQYRNLSHVKIDDTTKGFIYEKNNKVIALINTEKKSDGKIWIQGLEIFGDNKGTGLSIGLLDIAVNELKATNLSVRKTNNIAKKYMLIMVLKFLILMILWIL